MADQRLPQKDEKVTPQNNFKIHVVDPDDLTVHPSGKSFWMSRANFLGNLFDSLFTGLTDTPSTYTGQGLKTLQVNADENALVFEFAEFLKLNDVDEVAFTSKQGQIVKVNATADGLEFGINSFINLDDVSENTLEFQQGKFVYVHADLGTEPATYSLKFQNLPTYETFYGANSLIIGGISYRGTGLNYTVWAEKYIINGQYLETPIAAEVTNSNGDATFDRFDVYYIEIDNSDPPMPSIGILEGTPSASPVIPTLDLTKQVQVSVRLIAANETSDPDVTIEEIFNDNTGLPNEWVNILLPSGANLASLIDPKIGTSSALFPAYATPSIVSWQNNIMVTYNGQDDLVFYLKNTYTFTPQASLQIKLINTVTSDNWLLTLTPANLGNYGYINTVSDWQLIQIKLSDFVTGSRSATEYDTLQISFDRTPILGIDWVVLQTGNFNPNEPTIRDAVLKAGSVMDANARIEFNSDKLSGIKFKDNVTAGDVIFGATQGPAGIFQADALWGINATLDGFGIVKIDNSISSFAVTMKPNQFTISASIAGAAVNDEVFKMNTNGEVTLVRNLNLLTGMKSDGANQSPTKVFTTDGGILDIAPLPDVIHGWANYEDAETTPATQIIGTTAVKLQIDGAGAGTNTDYLPKEIRGISELWDTTNDKIIAISEGDTYDVRLILEITAKSGLPKVLEVIPDIGGGAGITVPIPGALITVDTGVVPFPLPIPMKFYALSTFITNGCQLFLRTDTGTLTVGSRSIFIERSYKGSL